ncbi:24225_t:CDS:2 [Dentiscutata erythropus]|uniref:24225_t:CDS:1 n=1 Tax=Dentiscutata erythropus TaxID=1348616 RepID=A0A9N8Z796_9GLOM|nr:24225_t:CDS:2 [Dentiscutata erythropus]
MSQRLSLSSTITLNNGIGMGGIGSGTEAPQGEITQNVILWAIESGYRHIDTAPRYGNEEDIGIGIIKSGIPRDQLFITTKIWDDGEACSYDLYLNLYHFYTINFNVDADQGYESTLMAAETSLSKLQTSYIDLLLIHSPRPGPQKRIESYRALQELVKRGSVRSIGVSNYGVKHLKELIDTNPEIMPAVNQIEIHPWNNRKEIISYCAEHKIIVEAFSPLTRGKKLNDSVLVNIAEKYNKSSAQVLIRWCLQNNFIVLPKSTNKTRIADNTIVYDFVIEEEDMNILDNLDEHFVASSWDPATSD